MRINKNPLLESALKKGLEGEGLRVIAGKQYNVLVCSEMPKKEERGASVVLVESLGEASWAIAQGAAGCHFYRDGIDILAEKIRRVADGDVACSVEVLHMALRKDYAECLTIRERQILPLVQQGLRNKEIAKNLGLSLATVKNHVHSILAKLKAKSRRHLARLLTGELPPPLSRTPTE